MDVMDDFEDDSSEEDEEKEISEDDSEVGSDDDNEEDGGVNTTPKKSSQSQKNPAFMPKTRVLVLTSRGVSYRYGFVSSTTRERTPSSGTLNNCSI